MVIQYCVLIVILNGGKTMDEIIVVDGYWVPAHTRRKRNYNIAIVERPHKESRREIIQRERQELQHMVEYALCKRVDPELEWQN
jgi:predicted SpoU family rRNA methylase